MSERQHSAAIALAQTGAGRLVFTHVIDEVAPCVEAVPGGFMVAAWVFVSDQAVAEELSAETVDRLQVA